MDYSCDMELALDIARRAGEVALRHFAGATETEDKPDLSPVTIADRETEMAISRLLEEYFPGDGILGEEGASKPSRSGRRWLVDPIDGTRDFIRRNPFWSVQLALEDRGRIAAGLIYLPCTNEMFHASLGAGCFWNDTRTHASEIACLDKAVLAISAFKDVWKSYEADQIHYLTRTCWTVRAYGGCYDVTSIARGKADLWLSGNGMEWDYAPAVIIAAECGARFITRIGDNRIDGRHAVICTRGLEEEVRRILNLPHPPAP